MKQKTVKVTTDNKISMLDVDFGNFKSIQQAIGGHFETVRTQLMVDYFGDGSMITLVDEEGLLKGLPVNSLGCALYGTPQHGCPIVGDLIFARISGEDIVAPDNPETLKDRLFHTFLGLSEE